MPSFHAPSGSRVQSPDYNANTVITVASAAAAGTKGAWSQVIASTSFDIEWMLVGIDWGTLGRTALVDIGIGAAASEVVICADLPYEQGTGAQNGAHMYILPIPIKSGTRIAARANISGATVKNLAVWIQCFASEYISQNLLSQCTVYGTATTPALTNIDPGGTAGTKGAYAQIVASTTYDIKAIQFVCAKANTATAIDWKVDLAVGAGGSEQIVLPDYYCALGTGAGSVPVPTVSPVIPMDIPSGTRLSARCSASITTATTRTLDVAVVGMA